VYRFALRPWWLLSHLLVVGLIVAMANLGFWQLRRLDDRRATNSAIAERAQEPPVPVEQLVDVDDDVAVGKDLAWRRVTAAGVWQPEDEVLVRNRSLDQRPGFWVLSPLLLDSGVVAVVNRGWVPLRVGEAGVPVDAAAPAEGDVVVEALLQPTQRRGSIGPTDPPDGVLDVLSRADVERLDAQLEQDALPVVLQLTGQEPRLTAEFPAVLPLPEQDEGPHLGYAVQWFIFTTIAVLGYPFILRRVALGAGRSAPLPLSDGAS